MRFFFFAAAVVILIAGCATPPPSITPGGVTADVTCEPPKYQDKKFPRIAIAGETVYVQEALGLATYRVKLNRDEGKIGYVWFVNPSTMSHLSIDANGGGMLASVDPNAANTMTPAQLMLYAYTRDFISLECKGLAK